MPTFVKVNIMVWLSHIYKGDFKDIKLIETKGEDVGTANIKLVVEPEGACIQTEYNGYKYGQCGLCVGLNGRDVKITDIVLSVDGKEETLHFDKELIYRTCEDSDALSWGTCPASSLGGASKEMDMSFEMFARKDGVINRVSASSNYDVKVISCEINDESDMSENIKLYEEDKIRFFCKFIKKTDSIFCVTSFIVEYTDEDGKAGKAICPFNASINIIDEEKVPEIMKKIYEEQV